MTDLAVVPASLATSGMRARLASLAAILLFALALGLPLLVTPLPPLLDYPNHLARMDVLAHAGSDPTLSRFYAVQWSVLPNLAMDLVVPPLLRILSLQTAGRLFVALALFLPVFGAVALHRSVFRRWSPWPFASGLIAYNATFLAGFLNFEVGLGLALLGAALWLRLKGELARVSLASAGAIVLFFCHLIACALFLLLLAALATYQGLGRYQRIGDRRILLWASLQAIIPALAPAALYLHATELAGLSADPYWTPPLLKLWGALFPVLTYSPILDGAVAVAVPAVIASSAVRRRLAISVPPCLTCGAAVLLYFVLPSFAKETYWLDERALIFGAFLLFAAVDPRPGRTWPVLLSGLFLARIAIIAAVWNGHNADIADLYRVIAPVHRGERVLVVEARKDPDLLVAQGGPASRRLVYARPTYWNLPALLLIRQRAFWPGLFSDPTKQPIRVRAPYDGLSVATGAPPAFQALTAPSTRHMQLAPYLAEWRRNFDYVLVLANGTLANPRDPLPGMLRPLVLTDIAGLYRIEKDRI